MFRVGDRVTVVTLLSDPSRIQAHRHAVVCRVVGPDYWVGHPQDDPELFGPFPAGRLMAGWGVSRMAQAATAGLIVQMGGGFPDKVRQPDRDRCPVCWSELVGPELVECRSCAGVEDAAAKRQADQ